MFNEALTWIDVPTKPAFQHEHIDNMPMFNSSSSLDRIDGNLPSDLTNYTLLSTPTANLNDIPTSSTSIQIENSHHFSNDTSPVSDQNTLDSYILETVEAPDNIDFESSEQPSKGKNCNNYKPTPQEDEIVRRIHRKVGGPAKLSTYDEPAKVRKVVIEALANEQKFNSEACRIRRGQLSASERRVVRTVTNRGAAVRSRMRQRREMAALRLQVRARDGRVKQLEAVVRALCSAYAVPLPPSVIACGQDQNENICVPSGTTVEQKQIQQQIQQQQIQQQIQQRYQQQQSHHFDAPQTLF